MTKHERNRSRQKNKKKWTILCYAETDQTVVRGCPLSCMELMNMEEEIKLKYQRIFQQFFLQSDTFLVCKWGAGKAPMASQDTMVSYDTKASGDTKVSPDTLDACSEEDRKEAYQNFYKRVKKAKICNRQTIRRWFGLDGCSIPGREHVFQIAFAVGLSSEETEEYLKYGISEPGFQISDYTECIMMYCLDHGYDRQVCEEMIEFFERRSDRSTPLEQTSRTEEMMEMYAQLKKLSKEEFLAWMCENCGLFKGYSMTTYRIFQSLIDEAIGFFRMEAREILFRKLQETDFFTWAGQQHITEEHYGEAIRRYIKNMERRKDPVLSPEEWRELKQQMLISYASRSRISDLLRELYSPLNRKTASAGEGMWKMLHREIGTVDAKYVSEMLKIAQHKKDYMELNRALAELKQMSEEEACPSWILALLPKPKGNRVKEVKKQLEKSRAIQGQRVRTIRRSDLLVLLQYISCEKYLERLSSGKEKYCGTDAEKEFVAMADSVLESCGMRPIDSRYRLDHTLLSCFEKDNVFLFAEIFEE